MLNTLAYTPATNKWFADSNKHLSLSYNGDYNWMLILISTIAYNTADSRFGG